MRHILQRAVFYILPTVPSHIRPSSTKTSHRIWRSTSLWRSAAGRTGEISTAASAVPMLHSNRLRFRVDPRDVPAEKAARRLHLTPVEFRAKLPELLARDFPRPNPTTGMFDLRG